MKNFILFLSLVSATSASAGVKYGCVGTDQSGTKTEIELTFKSLDAVLVNDMEGTETSFPFKKLTARNRVYADYDYDGYGGFIELLLPKNFTNSDTDAAEVFQVKFHRETYSELGHVETTTFTGTCERNDNSR